MSNCDLFHTATFADIPRAIGFLEAVGFTKAIVVNDEERPEVVVHAQYRWRDTGGIMFGSPRSQRSDPGDTPFADSVGTAVCYCVVEHDADVDDVHAKALAAGATSIQVPLDQDYGGRVCTVADAEGNQWSFGSYAGEG